jgi:Protein of unknown function (DUF1091)
MKVYVTLRVRTGQSKDYDKVIIKTNVDTCSIQKGIVGSFLVKLVLEKIDLYTNFKFQCPQPKGFYHAYNLPINDALKFVPISILRLSTSTKQKNWELVAIVKSKLAKTKPMVHLVTVAFRGVVVFEE